MPLLGLGRSRNLLDILAILRRKALRKGVWFQAMTVEDRILASLIHQHVKIVKNATLATVIARILGKLASAIQNSYLSRLQVLGRPIATAIALKAYSYGNKEALNWKNDPNYIRYMGMTVCSIPSRGSRVGNRPMVSHQRVLG